MNRIAIVLLMAALGCGPRLSSEQEVEQRRAQYTASLKSLTVEQAPVIGEPAGDANGATAPAPVVRTDAILDIVISTDCEEPLPGVTIDVEHLDAARRAKGRSTFWVDTATLSRGQSAQVEHVLEDVVWETGDAFAVSVRTPISESERAEYREFGVSAR